MEALSLKNNNKKVKLGGMDFSIFLPVLLLCALGLVMVFSASYYSSEEKLGDGLFYVRKQGLYLLISLPAMLLLTRVDYHIHILTLKNAWQVASDLLQIHRFVFHQQHLESNAC